MCSDTLSLQKVHARVENRKLYNPTIDVHQFTEFTSSPFLGNSLGGDGEFTHAQAMI